MESFLSFRKLCSHRIKYLHVSSFIHFMFIHKSQFIYLLLLLLLFVSQVQQEFGSFSNYCWAFTNHKPIKNGFRYGRQVPVKSPKADLISKDMLQRGFRCVGPTVIYSFMQVSGIVNDHLIGCFRYQQCNDINVAKDLEPKKTNEKPDLEERLSEALLEKTSLLS